MKLKATFTSGISPQEFDTSCKSVEEFLFHQYGSRINFENLGGTITIIESAVVAEAASAPEKKGVENAEQIKEAA